MRAPLPDGLGGRSFTRGDAAAAGLAEGRLRRKDVMRPYRGVLTTTTPETTLERCTAYAVRLKPGQFFTHRTAAELHGFTLPSSGSDGPIHVGALRPADAPHSEGVRGHRLQSAGEPWQANGLPIPDPLEVFCQMGADLGIEDLVVMADEIMNRSGLDEEILRVRMLERIGLLRRTGAGRLAAAVQLTRRGSRSPAETRVRLVLEAAGRPRPELNGPITDPATGRHLGSPDFVWRDQRVVLEYEGEQHRLDQGQFRYDIVRYEELAAAGWRVLRATGDDLTREGRKRLAKRVARALAT